MNVRIKGNTLQEHGMANKELETEPQPSSSLPPPSQSRGSLSSTCSSLVTSSGYCADITGGINSGTSDDDYHDAVEEVSEGQGTTKQVASSENSSNENAVIKMEAPDLQRQRRKRIPDSADKKFSIWSFIKNNIGKDFARTPLPVYFSEPLSLLQRLVEQMLSSELLYKASQTSDNLEQMCLIGAFAVSVTQAAISRKTKSFNPLLGETFECDRTDDCGWKAIAEQVRHLDRLHPLFIRSSSNP